MKEEIIEARALVNGFLMLSTEVVNIEYAKKCATFSVCRTIDFLNTMSSFVNNDRLKSDIEYLESIKKEIHDI